MIRIYTNELIGQVKNSKWNDKTNQKEEQKGYKTLPNLSQILTSFQLIAWLLSS